MYYMRLVGTDNEKTNRKIIKTAYFGIFRKPIGHCGVEWIREKEINKGKERIKGRRKK